MKWNLPAQDRLQKAFSVVQLIIFLLLLTALIRVLWLLTDHLILRILGLIAVYVIVSLFTYCVLRPLFLHIEALIRKKSGRKS